ncbi:MAG: hypothetical protein WDZ76_02965 [Pseudohongiellaceae bacterium]
MASFFRKCSNRNDDIFDDLIVWIDANINGKSSANELFSLHDLGISSISLENKVEFVQQNGNFLVKHGSFRYEDGRIASMVDVHFDVDSEITEPEIGLIGISTGESAMAF